MLRSALTLACFLTVLGIASSDEKGVDPLRPHNIDIEARALSPDDATRNQPGLVWVEGWTLHASNNNFGGFSALRKQGDHFVMVSDIGAIVEFDWRRGAAMDAKIDALPKGCGSRRNKKEQDSESLAIDPVSGTRWIGLEMKQHICVIAKGASQAREIVPPDMKNWPRTGGPESLAWLRRGGLLVLAERDDDWLKPVTPALYFSGGPQGDAAKAVRLGYRAPKGYRAVDAAELPDGRLLVLNRSFAPPFNFSAKLVVIDTPRLAAGDVLEGREIASFAKPGIVDNFEGLAIDARADGIHIWIISDDNFMRPIEQSYLLHFKLK